MSFMKRIGVVVLGLLMLAGHAPREAAASAPPGTGLVAIIRPTGGQVGIPPGATQVKVHLQVAFGKDLAGAAADPATFTAKVTGMSSLLLMPLFTDVKDANGNVIGKKADVTLPLNKKYSFSAKVSSIPVGTAKPVKDSVKISFVAVVVNPAPPVIQNFSIMNAVGAASGGKPLVNVGQSVIFQADLSDPDGDAIVSYALDLGDGSTPILRQSPSGLASASETVVYNASGDFNATLTVTDSSSQTSSQTLALHVNAPPTAKLKINPTQATFGYPVTFDALDGGDPDGDALTYAFDFGDGSAPVSGASPTATHKYPTNTFGTGHTFSVTLTVTDSYGAAATAKSSLLVTGRVLGVSMLNVRSPLNGEVATAGATLPVDIALGKATSGADPDPATFMASLNRVSVAGYFTPVKDPKRNNAVVGMHGDIPASKVFMNGASNSLRVSIKSKAFQTLSGSTMTVSAKKDVGFTATAGHPPTASFTATPSEATVGQMVAFDGSGSHDPAGKPLTYAWDFGDGAKAAASVSAMAFHTYAAAGPYTVILTVSDGALGATATGSVTVRAVVTGGTPVLTVSVPSSATNTLDFGDLNGNKNISVSPTPFSTPSQLETYPAWVEKCVEITNTGTGTLTVGSVSIDNAAAFQVLNAANVQAKTLAAGESDFIDVRFNPRPYTPGIAPPPAAPGSQAGTLTIVTNAATNGTQTVSLTGNVVSDVSASNIRLMRSDEQRIPDDSGVFSRQHQPGNASVLDVGTVASSKSFLFGGVVNQGDATGTIIGVDVVNDQGQTSPDFSAQLVHMTFSPSAESAISMAPGASLEGRTLNPTTLITSGDFIQVTFHPTNTVPAQQRLSARMLIHTDSGVDQVVGLTGIGIDAPYYTIPGGNFEFSRTSPGSKTTNLYESSNVSPATLSIVNIGRQSGTITASLAGIDGGAATGFSISPSSLSLGPTQSGTFTLTFAPTAAQHYAGVLTVNPGIPYEPVRTYFLHGYGKGGVGMLGTSRNWYTYDGNDFAQTEMIALGNSGAQSNFSQIDGLQDPFLVSGNTVDMSQYSTDWSSLVLLAGKEYTIDGTVFGPYSLTNADGTPNTQLTSAAKARLQSGQPIYSGGVESRANFVAGIDGHVDMQSEGRDPIRLDVTPNNVLFYTSVSSSSTAVVTALKWKDLSVISTGGVVVPDVVAALGGAVPANDEVLDMRVIKTSTGYRVFLIFDDSDANFNQIVADMDLSTAFAITAHKSLTGTLSAASNDNAARNGPQPIIIDANGMSYTSGTVQNADGTATMQVFREDLHADAGETLFGSVTVNFGDSDGGEILLDNQGNVFLMTHDGLCAFSPTGAFNGYIMEGLTYYADNFAGGSANGSDTQDLSDFNAIWLDK